MVDRMGDPMPAALDAQLDASRAGPERFVALAESALREACQPLDVARELRLPVFLGLPELRPGFYEQDAASVRSGIQGLERLPVQISRVETYTAGHAAGLVALQTAFRSIVHGTDEACLVGGVDSYFHPDTMEWLDDNRQLLAADARSAFVPGEGAGFCLLMSEAAWRSRGFRPLSRITGVSVGMETSLIKTSDTCVGHGLTATLMELFGQLAPEGDTIDNILCDINGERYRGEEWGFVCIRISRFLRRPTSYRSPAGSWGDLGAASGPLFMMLACRAAAGGYATGPKTLLWASSEKGTRGAALLDFAGIDIRA
jgi:3-oxoacyl-[acyl-carrier-protein] synthase-1